MFGTEQLLRHIGITRAGSQVEQSVRLPFGNLPCDESIEQFIDGSARASHCNDIAPYAQFRYQLRISDQAERFGQRSVSEDRVSRCAHEGRWNLGPFITLMACRLGADVGIVSPRGLIVRLEFVDRRAITRCLPSKLGLSRGSS